MKQIISTLLVALCITFNAAAQNNFKTIHFTYKQMKSDGVGGEYANVTSSGPSTGTIDIDNKDSVIRIQTGTPGGYGYGLKIYKFSLIDNEKTGVYEDGRTLNNIVLHGTNSKGLAYNALLARKTQKGQKDVMQFYITYDKQNQEIFICDYEKDIYK